MINIDLIVEAGKTQCYRLANADGKAWILPAKNMDTALELYQPSGTKGKLLKKLFPYLHSLSIVRKRLKIQSLSIELCDEIAEEARKSFGVKDLEFSIFEGTPSVHQKITIQFFVGNKILSYAKVTDSEDIAALFFHEQQLLDNLKRKGVGNIPQCLACKKLDSGLNLFVQSTVKSKKSFSPARWTNLHEDFLTNLAERTATELSFEESDFYKALQALEDALPIIPSKYQSLINQSMAEVKKHYQHKHCRFAAYHADFTPWNMFIEQNRLFVFDWEYGCMTYPPMLDRYHFHIQQAIHVAHMPVPEILANIKKQSWFSRIDLKCYLLDIISRFVCRENGKISKGLDESLNIWTQLLQLLQ